MEVDYAFVVPEVRPELRGGDGLDGEGHAVVVQGDVLAGGKQGPAIGKLAADLLRYDLSQENVFFVW